MATQPVKKDPIIEQMSLLKLLLGVIIGGITMWWTLHDRIANQVEEEVTERVNTATRLARIDERLKAAEERQTKYDEWQRTHTDRLNAVFQLIGKQRSEEALEALKASSGKSER